jgi:hypothetical protein
VLSGSCNWGDAALHQLKRYIDTTMLAPSAAELNIIDYMPGGAQIEPQRGNPSRFLADPLTTQEQTSDCD